LDEECPYGKILKVIEILSESPNNWEEATQNVVAEASKTLRNIRSVYIKEFTATVENDKISNYRVTAKVTFEMERS
jgi:flavin-binding protein dodecin